MKYFAYVIFDRVSGLYSLPFFMANRALAVRMFNYTMSQNPISSADCQLFEIGTFDTEIGLTSSYPKAEFVCNYEGDEKQ